MKTKTVSILSIACVAGSLSSTTSSAASAEGWQFEVSPYLLAAGMDGTIGVKGYTTDIDVSFSDIAKNLKGGFMGLFTARKGPWKYGLEGVYMKLEDSPSGSITGPGGNVSVGGKLNSVSKMYIYQGTVGYRVLDGKTKLDVLGALRYTKLEADMTIKVQFNPGVVFPGGKLKAGGSESWTDAVVGFGVSHQVSDNVTLVGYADVGGSSDDTTYQFIAGADWEFKKDYLARFGYRYLSWDYESGGTTWDIATSGPYIGLGIRF